MTLCDERFLHLGLGWIGDRGGGLERYQDGICAAHQQQGIDVTAWIQSRVPVAGKSSYPVVAYASPEEPRKLRLRKLRELAQERFSPNSLPTTLVSHHASVCHCLLDIAHRVPHIVHFQGPWADEALIEGGGRLKSMIQRFQEHRVYKSAARIITLSTAFKNLVVNQYGVDESRVRVVPGAIDARAADPGISRLEARERLGWPVDRPILISIRRLVRRVGIDVLIEAIRDVVAKQPDLLVLIGGTGPLRAELELMIDRDGLEQNVRLLGFVPDEHLSMAYRAADYSVVPTQALEGFGLVTVESMATGTPSIVTPVGSLPEVVVPLSESLVLPGKSAADIATGLCDILGGRVTLPDEQACREYVRQNFDWSVIAPRVLEVYREAN